MVKQSPPFIVSTCQVTQTAHSLARETKWKVKMCTKSAIVCVSVSWVGELGDYLEEGGRGDVWAWMAVGKWGGQTCHLVQCPTAVLCSTQARNLVLLKREFVVVGDFFVDSDGLLRVDHNLLLGLYGDNLGITVWLEKQSNERVMSSSTRV